MVPTGGALRRSLLRRSFSAASAILNPADPAAPLSGKQKSRAALALLKSEGDPDRIVEICQAAALTPEFHLDRIIFSLAISKLAAAKAFATVRSFLDGLLASRPDLQNDRFRCHAIILFGQAGMTDDAVRVFKSADEPSVKSLNALLFACVLAKKHDEVGRLFRELPQARGISPDVDTYNTVVKAFGESGSSGSVFSILDEMERRRIKPNAATYAAALEGFYREERFDDVGKLLEMMQARGCPPGLGTYNVRIHGLCKLGRPAEARALFEGMLSRGIRPNAVSYNHLIHGFCKQGDTAEARRLFGEMGEKKCPADSSCYFTLIYYLCQAGEFEAALGLCRESMEKNWVPSFSLMRTLVQGLAKNSNKLDDAREIVRQLKERFSRNTQLWDDVEQSLA